MSMAFGDSPTLCPKHRLLVWLSGDSSRVCLLSGCIQNERTSRGCCGEKLNARTARKENSAGLAMTRCFLRVTMERHVFSPLAAEREIHSVVNRTFHSMTNLVLSGCVGVIRHTITVWPALVLALAVSFFAFRTLQLHRPTTYSSTVVPSRIPTIIENLSDSELPSVEPSYSLSGFSCIQPRCTF